MGKSKASTFMVLIAIGLVGIALWMMEQRKNRLVAEERQRAIASVGTGTAEVQRETVVVVQVDKIPAQVELSRDMLQEVQMPAEAVPSDAVKSIDETTALYTLVPFIQGDVLRRNKLSTKEEALGLNFKIPKGQRAISFYVNEQSGVNLEVNSGDKVDIVAIFRLAEQGQQDAILAQTLLQNVLVLGSSGRADEEGRAADAKTLTVAVSPSEAEIIALMAQEAKLVASLRPVQDDSTFESESRSMQTIVKGEATPEPEAPAPEKRGPTINILGPGGRSQQFNVP